MACTAFEALYGGAAGGGKSEALLHAALAQAHRPTYVGLLLRRSFPDLEKSLIDRSRVAFRERFPGAVYHEGKKVWTFPSGAKVYFGYLERDADVLQYQGAEFQFVGFDELTHFTEKQYTYLLSRIRGTRGIPLRMRAATNPGGPGHEWVMKRWAPWLDPSADRHADSGEVLRYRSGADGEAWDATGALSRTFIPARLADTPQLAGTNYDEQLGSLDAVTRAQLLDGNWLIRPAAGLYFKRSWFVEAPPLPREGAQRVRYWDRAATDGGGDWTVGLRLARSADGVIWVEDVVRLRGSPAKVEAAICATAVTDGRDVMVGIEEDPGSAGKFEAAYYVRALQGFNVRLFKPSGDKVTRAQPVSAQAEAGNVRVPRGAKWLPAFLQELEEFPDGQYDDQVDALSGAFTAIAKAHRPFTASTVPSRYAS